MMRSNYVLYIHNYNTSITFCVVSGTQDESSVTKDDTSVKTLRYKLTSVVRGCSTLYRMSAILNWIGQEQAYLQAIVALPEKKEAQEGVKMHTSLPVAILAVIARLMKDSGIITNANQTEIFNFFTSKFVTQQKKGFSYEHLRTRYYQVEERTKEKAYDYLMEMAQLCKKL